MFNGTKDDSGNAGTRSFFLVDSEFDSNFLH